MMDMKDSEELEDTGIDFSATSENKQSADSNRYISDTIKVVVIPEKKGTFLKHTEYEIESEKHKSKVERRYNDFVQLHNQLLLKYPNRMIPRLPPKQIMLDSFLEERRCGLQRWLRLLSHHHVLADDSMIKCFLTDSATDRQNMLQEAFLCDTDEFNHLDDDAKLPVADKSQLSDYRDKIRVMLNCVVKLKRLIEQQAKRELNQSKDFSEMAHALCSMSADQSGRGLTDFANKFLEISRESESVSQNQQRAVMERLELIVEALAAHSDLCERVDKRINFDPQANLIRTRIQNAVRTSPEIPTEKQQSELEASERQNAFALLCLSQETKFAENYVKLLPSILLQFTNEESKGFSNICEILKNILQIESDKMN